jgi:hypothetical protein
LEAIIAKVVNGGGGVIFIDEAYQLTSEGGSGRMVLDTILTEMENRAGTIAFIFAGYNKEMEKFFQHNPGLPSRVPYTMKFEDYTDREFTKMFEQLVLKKYNGRMKVEDGVDGMYTKVVIRRLASGRDRPGFGNARSLQLVFQKITERQAIRVTKERRAGNRVDDFFFSKEDLIGPDPSQAILKSKAWTELQGMIGLDAVKKSVKQMVDMLSVNYKRELNDKKPLNVPLNRVFLGSPGTGKTTVGKLYGQILADIGMLSNGEGTMSSDVEKQRYSSPQLVVIKNPSDFIGSHLGQSEANTKGILASTLGKVLLIDEVRYLSQWRLYLLKTGLGIYALWWRKGRWFQR